MAIATLNRAPQPKPLSDGELDYLKQHTDRDFQFWLYQDPRSIPDSVKELHTRYHATRGGGVPPRKPPVVAVATPPPPGGREWAGEFFSIRVRVLLVIIAALIGFVVFAPIAVAVVLFK